MDLVAADEELRHVYCTLLLTEFKSLNHCTVSRRLLCMIEWIVSKLTLLAALTNGQSMSVKLLNLDDLIFTDVQVDYLLVQAFINRILNLNFNYSGKRGVLLLFWKFLPRDLLYRIAYKRSGTLA